MPTVPKHRVVTRIPENEDFVLTGCGGSGKSWEMRKFASKLKEKGKKVYIISFQNSVAAKSNGMTCHQFCRKMSAGEIETPCHVLWDECFYSNMFVLSRMVHWRLLPDITWGFVGDPSQPQQLGHWRGVTCRNGLKVQLANQANRQSVSGNFTRNASRKLSENCLKWCKNDRGVTPNATPWSSYLPEKTLRKQ